MGDPKHVVAVSGLVENEDGDVLMLYSPKREDWEFPGGQVEEGELLTAALVREVFEETGISVTVGDLVGVYTNTRQPYILMLCFICSYVEGELRTSAESSQVAWVPRDEALGRIMRPAAAQKLADKLNFEGRVVYRAYNTRPDGDNRGYEVLEERWI